MPPGGKPYFGPHNLALPPGGGLLIVRHSARYPIRSIPESYVATLTDEGRAMARAFGAQLGPRWTIGEAVASPTARCMETAQEIVCGALDGQRPPPEVRPLTVLHFDQKLTGIPGLAGVFLDDPGFTALASNPSSQEYALLRETLLDTLPFPSEPGVLNIGSTHDVLITFLQASLLGVPQASPADFPGFLEGVCLVKENGRVRLF
jgi:hypothetical protein